MSYLETVQTPIFLQEGPASAALRLQAGDGSVETQQLMTIQVLQEENERLRGDKDRLISEKNETLNKYTTSIVQMEQKVKEIERQKQVPIFNWNC